MGVHIDETACLSPCVDCGVHLGVCGPVGNEGDDGARTTLVDVNESLDAPDGSCLNKAQATWRASTALRSVDGDTEIIRSCLGMGRKRKGDGRTMFCTQMHKRKKDENKLFRQRELGLSKHKEILKSQVPFFLAGCFFPKNI